MNLIIKYTSSVYVRPLSVKCCCDRDIRTVKFYLVILNRRMQM